jgi:hypothetical protein
MFSRDVPVIAAADSSNCHGCVLCELVSVDRCYDSIVRGFALAIFVALLTFSASGAYALVVAEPCTGSEQSGQEDAACPPTCVTCGCCTQAVEPVALLGAVSPDTPIAEIHAPVSGLPRSQARDILHVPKLRLA